MSIGGSEYVGAETNGFKFWEKGAFLDVCRDSLSVVYIGRSKDTEVSVLQAWKSIGKNIVEYFEVEIDDGDDIADDWEFSLGLTGKNYSTNQHVGMGSPEAYGFHSSGNKCLRGNRMHYATKVSKGSTMGCGYIPLKKQIFFTKNGENMGSAFVLSKHTKSLFPTIALKGTNLMIKANFGEEPFLFDLDLVIQREKAEISHLASQTPHKVNVGELIRTYLYYMAFIETLESYEKSSGLPITKLDDHCNVRKQLYELIMSRDSLKARTLFLKIYEKEFSSNNSIFVIPMLYLNCQVVIDFCKDEEFVAAMLFARDHLNEYVSDVACPIPKSKLSSSGWPNTIVYMHNGTNGNIKERSFRISKKQKDHVLKTIKLITEKNPNHYLFQDNVQLRTFEVINRLILEIHQDPIHSCSLSRTMKQFRRLEKRKLL